jgi:MFS family permease
VQGLGAAIISPTSLAIITTSFHEPRERARAIIAWGAMGAIGGALGALLGGLLADGFGWPAVFLVNLTLASAILALGPRLIPEGRSRAAHNTSTCSARASSQPR